MHFLSHQDMRNPLCPSCQECLELCKHIARCPDTRQMHAFMQSVTGVKIWLEKNSTHPNLQSLLLKYLHGRGTITCAKCSMALNMPHIIQEFAVSQDVIGWDSFIMGMVSSKLLPIQSAHSLTSSSSPNATRWISSLITQLLQVTHTQWIYQCILVHDRTTGTLISSHKGELLKEIDHQLSLGSNGLKEEDRFLLECNFDTLTTATGEQQEYWLLTIQAAREASHICSKAVVTLQQNNADTGQRRA
jgi:hypothetical protein